MWYLIVINKIILTPYHSLEFFHYQLIQKQSLYLKGLIRNRRWYHPSMVWSFPPFALIMVYTLFLFFFLFLSLFTFRIWLSMSLSIYLYILCYSKKNRRIRGSRTCARRSTAFFGPTNTAGRQEIICQFSQDLTCTTRSRSFSGRATNRGTKT